MKNKPVGKISMSFVVFICIGLAMVNAITHNAFIDARFAEINSNLHEQVLSGNAPAPIQYRIMTYYMAEGLMRMGLSFGSAWFILRFLFTFLAAMAFHYFLSFWFVSAICLAGTIYFFAVLPITYLGYYMQPMDIPNLFFFILGLVLILLRKDWWLVPLIFAAMLNRETAILLTLVYFFCRWDEIEIKPLFYRFGAMFVTGLGTYWLLRKVLGVKNYYSDMYYLGYNLSEIKTYVYALSIFGPFIFFAFYKMSDKPKFFKRAILIVPFFIIIHYTMTIMSEPRLWLPLLPILVGGGFWAVLPAELKLERKKEHPEIRNFLSNHQRFWYMCILASFLVFFAGFYNYYKHMHLKDREELKRAELLIGSARNFVNKELYVKAEEELKKALIFTPESDNVHYELALLYEVKLREPRKAIYHFQKCLQYNPYHLNRKNISSEIEKLKRYIEKN